MSLVETSPPVIIGDSVIAPPFGDPGLRRGSPLRRQQLITAVRDVATRVPASSPLAGKLAFLASLGRRDLVLGRLGEGHVDAVDILGEAGRAPVPDAVYGVWASRSQGTGLHAENRQDAWHLTGTLRFATGAAWIDRALVTALTPSGGPVLLDVDVRGPGWSPVEGSWPAVGMDLSESLDVLVDADVPASAQVGPARFYLDRPGFAIGGIGVAAVWLGGAVGVLDVVADGLRRFPPDPHQLAHLGAMDVAIRGADAVLVKVARQVADRSPTDLGPTGLGSTDLDPLDLGTAALAARSVVEEAVQVVLDRAPRLTGPSPLCRDAEFAHRMADLLVYVRQHHAERDLEALGRAVLADGSYGAYGDR